MKSFRTSVGVGVQMWWTVATLVSVVRGENITSTLLLPSYIKWQAGNLTSCETMNCSSIETCSYDSGVKLKFGERAGEESPNHVCIYFTTNGEGEGDGEEGKEHHYNSTSIIDWLGDNGVIVFTGDSIIRALFVDFLRSLGGEYFGWYSNLERLSGNWTGSLRTKIDHTYLCSGALTSRNITVAFLWRPFFGWTTSHVPWVLPSMPGKNGRCVWWENGDAMRHCDSSHQDGACHRWNCSDTLDSIQPPSLSGARKKRKFVVVSSGGQHTVVEELHRVGKVADNRTQYLDVSRKRFEDAWEAMENTKSHWDVVTKAGGRHIFLQPFKITFGLPRTVSGHHSSTVIMEDMLETHIRSRMRKNGTILTGENGLEVIELNSIFEGSDAPGSVGDGMHYGRLTNVAVLNLLARRLFKYNASNWRTDQFS